MKNFFATLAAVTLLGSTLLAADAPTDAQAQFTRLTDALKAQNLEQFIVNGDEVFLKTITPVVFEGACEALTERFNSGVESVYWGELKQEGYTVYVWKTSFKDGSDDGLVRVSMKDGKVGGFIFQ